MLCWDDSTPPPSFLDQRGDIQLDEARLRGNHKEKQSDREAVAMAEGRANLLQPRAIMTTERIKSELRAKTLTGAVERNHICLHFRPSPSSPAFYL